MLFAIGYLAVNVACLLVISLTKYHRQWRLFALQMALTCWQIGVLLWVSPTNRTMAIRWWLPGDIALLAVTGAAVLEVLWRAMVRFETAHKVGVLAGFVGGFIFAGLSIRWLLPMQTYGDWFAQLRSDRVVVNLCIATCAIIATGMMHSLNRGKSLWKIRSHAMLICTLACGHVLIADVGHWAYSRALYRGLETLCCMGWIVTARAKDQSGLISQAASTSIAPDPIQHLRALRIAPHIARGGFGSHHAPEQVAVWPLAAHAETR